MNSLILKATTRILLPMQLFLSVYFFLRGHNEPGGGFIAALMTVCAITLHLMAFGGDATKKMMHINPELLMILGWLSALLSGITSFFHDMPFMTGVWGASIYLPIFGNIKISTVLFFDLGVYLLVCGALIKVIILADEEG